MCNNGDVFAVFYLNVLFQFVNSNVGGGLLTLRVDCLSPNLSLGIVLIPLKLLLCRVSGNPNATEFWPLIDRNILPIACVLSKKALYMLDFSVLRYLPVIGSQAYVFPFERYLIY